MTSDSVKHHSVGAAILAGLLVFACGAVNASLENPAPVHAAQNAATASPATLIVEGAGPAPVTFTAADLAKMPRATATVSSDGSNNTYEGVLLYDILVKAGWQPTHGMAGMGTSGKGMAGMSSMSYVLATAKDGFRAVFALAEIDPQFSGVKVLVADKENGLPLADRYKPFRIISPQDKMRARSIYSLIKLEVITVK